jgi:thiol-disulfide isomerase/thioredoxin
MAKAAAASLVVAAALAVVAFRIAPPGRAHGVQFLPSGTPAQLSSFIDESGAAVNVESYRGKVLILNLWAAWCVPCLQEMPSLDRLAERLPENEFAVVAVTHDKIGDTAAKRAFDRLGLHRLKLYLDPEGNLSREIGARGMPTTLILGANGAPLSFREGEATWDSDEMIDYLKALAEPTPRTG